ncbi:unnamed protein product [Mytilus coruscus]|uniref:Uncharacterized protein n=1 Tax=Mytilus coruscus TaxID=42192 RepID=A0A6J8BB05_MYTCO|nr:unnamed protein product [Mytilus coruscus]
MLTTCSLIHFRQDECYDYLCCSSSDFLLCKCYTKYDGAGGRVTDLASASINGSLSAAFDGNLADGFRRGQGGSGISNSLRGGLNENLGGSLGGRLDGSGILSSFRGTVSGNVGGSIDGNLLNGFRRGISGCGISSSLSSGLSGNFGRSLGDGSGISGSIRGALSGNVGSAFEDIGGAGIARFISINVSVYLRLISYISAIQQAVASRHFGRGITGGIGGDIGSGFDGYDIEYSEQTSSTFAGRSVLGTGGVSSGFTGQFGRRFVGQS